MKPKIYWLNLLINNEFKFLIEKKIKNFPIGMIGKKTKYQMLIDLKKSKWIHTSVYVPEHACILFLLECNSFIYSVYLDESTDRKWYFS